MVGLKLNCAPTLTLPKNLRGEASTVDQSRFWLPPKAGLSQRAQLLPLKFSRLYQFTMIRAELSSSPTNHQATRNRQPDQRQSRRFGHYRVRPGREAGQRVARRQRMAVDSDFVEIGVNQRVRPLRPSEPIVDIPPRIIRAEKS